MVALGLLKDTGSVEPLRKVLTEEWDPHIKLQAGLALGILGDPEAAPRLLAVAKSATSILARGHACRILGYVGNRETAKELCKFVLDPKETGFLKMFAVTGLGILAERSEVPVLSATGFDFDPDIRNDALDEIAGYM
jgi:HEAT repeat protein